MTPNAVECKRCRRMIIWLRTERGKAMPVDEIPNPKGNVILVNGKAHVLKTDEAKPANVATLMPHFATCGH